MPEGSRADVDSDVIATVPCPGCGADTHLSRFVRMDIALSEYCNLKCQMCRRPSETLFMEKERCKRAMREAALPSRTASAASAW